MCHLTTTQVERVLVISIPPALFGGDEDSIKSHRRHYPTLKANSTLTDRAVGDGNPIVASGLSDFGPSMPSDVRIVQEPQAD